MQRFGHVHTPGSVNESGYCQTAIATDVELSTAGVPVFCSLVGWSSDGTPFKRKHVPYRSDGGVLADGDSFHAEGDCPYGR